uniref:Amine oxidase domain-containing protein n=1 Tax=Vannella robusta TaxID=1487602 RepID=A0A7S4IK06_9EUKA
MPHRVGIVGCGLAGLVAARVLSSSGCEVVVWDKSRGPGGRLAAKRSPHGDIDFGAQYFTCSDSVFIEQVDKWVENGVVVPWEVSPAVIDVPGRIEAKESSTKRFVGSLKMTSISRELEKDIKSLVHYETLITSVTRHENQWKISTNEDTVGVVDTVIVNTPPKQALPFLEQNSELHKTVNSVHMNPCWAISLTFSDPLDLSIESAFVNCGKLSWIAKNGSKANRTQVPETWVLHANPEWSNDNLERSPSDIESLLAEEFFTVLGIERKRYIHSIVHRWRYSIAKNPLSSDGYLLSQDKTLGVCGDWCNNGKVEGAYMSGYLLAQQLLRIKQ